MCDQAGADERRPRGLTAQARAERAAQQKMNDWIIDWAKAQSEGSLDEDVPFTFVNGTKAAMQRGEMFLHLVTHDSYHRGWVAEMFLEAGARPPETDLSR